MTPNPTKNSTAHLMGERKHEDEQAEHRYESKILSCFRGNMMKKTTDIIACLSAMIPNSTYIERVLLCLVQR